MAEEDLIYGKNRHLFGGIEPSNLKGFSIEEKNDVLRVTVTLPDDTVVDGQTLCTVAGAVIRRKEGNFPSDEFDGILVQDVRSSGSFNDSTANPDGTYYYQAFPYTSQGVYNRNKANRLVWNEPQPMTKFTAKSMYNAQTSQSKVVITAEIPSGIAGVIIRKSTEGYPEDETEGTLFMEITEDGTYEDTAVSIGTTYYYTAFPYTSTGAVNRSESNRTSVTAARYEYYFGYDLVVGTSDPNTRVSYPEDVDNAAFAAAAMNYASGVFEYGGWDIEPGHMFMPRPVMISYSGQVMEELDPNDYTKKKDGTASNVANTSFEGNAMMEWPKIYTKRWTEDGIYHFRCSDIQLDDDYDCWCNYDKNDNVIDHFYTPIYFGSNISSKLRSISGQSNFVNNTRNTECQYASNNGEGWYTEFLSDRLLIQDLLVMMAKSTDTQTKYGNGNCGTSAAIGQGTMNTKGLFWGSSNQSSGVKVFGMENWWGNLWRGLAGLVTSGSSATKYKITWGTHDGSTVNDFNFDGTGYLSTDYPTGKSGGYINAMNDFPYGRIPKTASGSASTFECDGLYFSSNCYAFVGGAWSDTLRDGAFCVHLVYATSNPDTHFGAALSYKPLAS